MASKSRIDRLGDRLRVGQFTDDDLRELDAYRRSFSVAYEAVIGSIRQEVALVPTGRPAKSSTAIVDKLQRETIRLSQIQDIAGCRIVVPDLRSQTETVTKLTWRFPAAQFVDRRVVPSHGYRAVHIIVPISGRVVEIQVRTPAQHWWAELSERLSDVFGVDIKYGAGDPVARRQLRQASTAIEVIETRGRQQGDDAEALAMEIADAKVRLGEVAIWAMQYVPLNPGF